MIFPSFHCGHGPDIAWAVRTAMLPGEQRELVSPGKVLHTGVADEW